ncbi:MAG: tetratricopeptide repeat protein [Candidatus Obscuribacterales bacterium]|nr:tetratricopeptide repeat protein [Candidatus Obscuribacterales bacterium]
MTSSAKHNERILALCLSLIMLSPGALAKGKGPWEEHIEAARTALNSGDFDSAARSLKDAMEDTRKFKDDDPRLGSTYFEMGELNVRIQNYTLAKEYYERALASQQKLLGAESIEAANSLYGIALCNQQLGDHLAAEIFLKRVDEIWRKKLGPRDPKLISILPSMAAYASMKGNLGSAESYYRQLVDIAQASGNQAQLGSYMNVLATILGNEGKFGEAKDLASRAVDNLKKSNESAIAIDSAEDNLAIIRSKTGEKPTITVNINQEKSAEQIEKDRLAAAKATEQAKLAAEKAKAAELAQIAAEKAKAQELARLAAEKARAEEQTKLAAEKAEAAKQAKIAAENAKAIEQSKLAAERAKADLEAKLAAEKAEAAEKSRLAAELRSKEAEKEAEEKKLAAAQAERQLKEKKAQEEALIAQNKQEASGDKIDSSKGPRPWHTDRVIKKPSADKSQQWGKVRYLAEGRLISAEEYKALLLANEAYEAMRQEKFRMAADILTKALEICPELPSAHTNLGLALNRLGKNDEAIEELRQAIALDPSRSAPWVNLASSFQTSGRLKDCVETYKEYLRRFPNDSLAVKAKDLVAHLQEEADEQEAVEKAIAASGASNSDYFPYTTASGTIKWPDNKLPLKVFVANGSRVPGFKTEYQGIMNDAFKAWSTASQDKVKFEFVNKAELADIECLWTNDYSKVSSPSEGGEAQVSWSSKGIEHVKVVILTADPTPDSPLTQNQIQAVCLHEIGHSIGLVGHSPNPSDIMFCSMPAADAKIALSQRDLGTIRHLYAPDVQIAIKPKSTGVGSSDKNAINNEGVALMSTNAYSQAIEKFEAALKLDPNYDLAKENLSKAYNKYALDLAAKGKEQEAESLLQKAMNLQNSIRNATIKWMTMHNYASFLRKSSRDSEAAKIEAEAKKFAPKEAN